MSPLFLRACTDVLATPLAMIYSKSPDNDYPVRWKLGYVTPNFAKVFEIIVLYQIKFNVIPNISSSQHGFLPGRRVESNLMKLTAMVHECFEEGMQTDVFYADIRKAFDVVCPVRLLLKLSEDKYRLSNTLILWLLSLLHNHKQLVKIGASVSDLISLQE